MTGKELTYLIADHEVMIRENREMIHELKTLNLRMKEIVEIDRKRLDYIELPWWRRMFSNF